MAQTIEELLSERAKTHGQYYNHAEITQETKDLWHTAHNFHELTDEMKETLDMIAHKVGRILSGDPNVLDHWDDIAGYSKLVSQAIVAGRTTKLWSRGNYFLGLPPDDGPNYDADEQWDAPPIKMPETHVDVGNDPMPRDMVGYITPTSVHLPVGSPQEE